MKKSFITILGTLIFCTSILSAQSSKGTQITFNAKDINNKNITESIFEDSEFTMVNIWGTFCGPCINEMPDLGKLSKDYDPEKFQMVGIVIDSVNRKGLPDAKTIEAAKKIVKQTEADYIHIVPDAKLLLGILYDVSAVPTTFFVNRQGEIVGDIYTGSRSYKDWQKIIDSVIK